MKGYSSDNIRAHTPREHARTRPDMYFNNLTVQGLVDLIGTSLDALEIGHNKLELRGLAEGEYQISIDVPIKASSSSSPTSFRDINAIAVGPKVRWNFFLIVALSEMSVVILSDCEVSFNAGEVEKVQRCSSIRPFSIRFKFDQSIFEDTLLPTDLLEDRLCMYAEEHPEVLVEIVLDSMKTVYNEG